MSRTAARWLISVVLEPTSPSRCERWGYPPRGNPCDLSPGGADILRQTDRTAAEFRRASGDRDGECAAHYRDTRGIGAADRDRRGVGGHQQLARRSRAGVRRDARQGDTALRGGPSVHSPPMTASSSALSPCTARRAWSRRNRRVVSYRHLLVSPGRASCAATASSM